VSSSCRRFRTAADMRICLPNCNAQVSRPRQCRASHTDPSKSTTSYLLHSATTPHLPARVRSRDNQLKLTTSTSAHQTRPTACCMMQSDRVHYYYDWHHVCQTASILHRLKRIHHCSTCCALPLNRTSLAPTSSPTAAHQQLICITARIKPAPVATAAAALRMPCFKRINALHLPGSYWQLLWPRNPSLLLAGFYKSSPI
jgi:hypothetical protein